jgi:hypothetical protein
VSAETLADLLAPLGVVCPPPPDTVPLRILGLSALPESMTALRSAYRDRVKAVHPDSAGVPDPDAVAELVWAKAVLLPKIPEPVTADGVTPCPDISRYRPSRCTVCGREGPVEHWRNRFAGYCWRCARAAENSRMRERRAWARADRSCEHCAATFTPTRSDGRYCCNACRQSAYRVRRHP